MLADTRRPILELWNEMLTYAHINGQNHPVVSASARDMLDRPRTKPVRYYQRRRLFWTFTGIRPLPRTRAVPISGSGI